MGKTGGFLGYYTPQLAQFDIIEPQWHYGITELISVHSNNSGTGTASHHGKV